ncbi:hypothetical protein PHJA_002607100 [Phtheirospermum japonicum]|uniref:Uncharacterized protein n=1 Tax=Phtheirospermum japonicum TaxID=374723 RepID=A0A830CXJ6_9LAMI|nr:hypothetical protein PHJA_002607100 [Phtheirospermum japonicum]
MAYQAWYYKVREKTLDKQLHSLIEQLAAKQTQAEGLISEIHVKELELEKLNGMWRRIENCTSDINMARNRSGKSGSYKELLPSDYSTDPHFKLPVHMAARNESLQRLMLLRLKTITILPASIPPVPQQKSTARITFSSACGLATHHTEGPLLITPPDLFSLKPNLSPPALSEQKWQLKSTS